MLRFRIEGMTCQGCADAVSRAVAGAAPGRPVKVTLATGEVEVGNGADPAAVAGAIEKAGFTVTERPGLPGDFAVADKADIAFANRVEIAAIEQIVVVLALGVRQVPVANLHVDLLRQKGDDGIVRDHARQSRGEDDVGRRTGRSRRPCSHGMDG